MSSERMKQRAHDEGLMILRKAIELIKFGNRSGKTEFLKWVGERWRKGTDFDRGAMAGGMAGAIVALIEGGKSKP